MAQGRPVSQRLSLYGAETVDATVALAKALSSLPHSQRRNGTAVDAAILSLNFPGVSGNVQFDEQGDRKDPRYSVWNLGPWNYATESFEWRIVGNVGPSTSQTRINNSSICWAELGCGAVPPSDRYQPRLGCFTGTDCVHSDQGTICDTTVGRCVHEIKRNDVCASRSATGHISLFEPIQVTCEQTSVSWALTGAEQVDSRPYTCNTVNGTETDMNGPEHEVASMCAPFMPDVLADGQGSSSFSMCCNPEDEQLVRWIQARWRQCDTLPDCARYISSSFPMLTRGDVDDSRRFDIQFGQCENCLHTARKLLCQVACDQGNYRKCSRYNLKYREATFLSLLVCRIPHRRRRSCEPARQCPHGSCRSTRHLSVVLQRTVSSLQLSGLVRQRETSLQSVGEILRRRAGPTRYCCGRKLAWRGYQ